MQIRITLLIVSFIYTMLTSIVYFSKNRINNSENAVYEKLLSITPIGLLLEIGCNVTAIYKMNELVSSIISRIYLIFILVWLTTFTLYILTITKYKGDKLTEYKNSKIRKSIIIGSIFSILLLIREKFSIFRWNGYSISFSNYFSFNYFRFYTIYKIF